MQQIRTSRLRLTPVTAQNASALWRVLQQPDLRTYQDLPNVGAAAFAQMVAKRPRRLEPGTAGRFEWLVYVHGTRRAVGWVSLRVTERDARSGEIGYSIVREFRGRGIATEAVRALLPQAFAAAGLERVRAYCLPENTASRRLLERVGFVREELLAHGATIGGRPVDVLAHVLERERWRQSGNSIEMPASAKP